MKLAVKLNAIFILLSIIPMAVVSYFVFDHGRQMIISKAFNDLKLTSILKRAEFEQWLAADKEYVKGVACCTGDRNFTTALLSHDKNDPVFKTAYRKLELNLAGTNLRERNNFIGLSILRADNGLIVYSTDKTLEGHSKESEPFFKAGKHRTYVQNLISDARSEGHEMHISTPVNDQHGNLIAVLVAQVNWTKISKIMMQGLGIYPSLETYLVNSSNMFVTESRFSPDYPLKKTVCTDGIGACLEQQIHKETVKET